ncbi:hypothetical protein [Candidatus Ruminimicrobium bovinum]|uniref:hypothetical protein n=1 Tax=Candidatus Ruminimicrobium bovinum TaxID=3242779 RepID=UPI0039B94BC8
MEDVNYKKLQKVYDCLSDNTKNDYKNKLKELLGKESLEIYLGEILVDKIIGDFELESGGDSCFEDILKI